MSEDSQSASIPFKVGEIARVTRGAYASYDVVIDRIDDAAETARVRFVVFGGTDARPFDIPLSNLSHTDRIRA